MILIVSLGGLVRHCRSAVRHRGEDWLRKFILGGSPFNAAALVSFGGGGALTRLPNIYAYPISMSLRGPIGDYYH